jgi:GAF domain-containing protein
MPARLPWLLDLLTRLLPVSGCWAMIFAEQSRRRFVATGDPLAQRMKALDDELVQSPGLHAARTGRRVFVPDLNEPDALDRFRRFLPRAETAGVAAVYSFPLWSADRRIGGLSLCSDVPVQFDRVELAQAGLLADLATALIVAAPHDRNARAWPQ